MAPPLRVLCFGDSLTQGYFGMGAGEHPYSEILETKLRAAFPDRDVSIDTSGVPGDMVCTSRFITRMIQEWHRLRFNWTIVLGGTNDIGMGFTAEKIFGELEKVWEVPLEKGSKVLALTIPECYVKMERVNNTRNELNKRILEYKARNYYAFDLHGAIPYHSLSKEDRVKYWDDGLHLTSDGYDWMGSFIADELIRIIKEDSTPPPAPRKSARTAAKKWYEGNFDEERGSPEVLSQGYVVVRKMDLD